MGSMMRGPCLAFLVLVVGYTQMKSFLVDTDTKDETKNKEHGNDYSDYEDSICDGHDYQQAANIKVAYGNTTTYCKALKQANELAKKNGGKVQMPPPIPKKGGNIYPVLYFVGGGGGGGGSDAEHAKEMMKNCKKMMPFFLQGVCPN